MNTDFIKSFLSDLEISKLAAIDEPTMVALKKVLLADAYYKGVLLPGISPDPTRNAALLLAIAKPETSDAVLSANLRAQAEAVQLVESGFKRLIELKNVPTPKPAKGNPAR